MPALSSIFLVLALVLAVVIGPQTRPWTWGPAMLMLGISVIAALPAFWKKTKLTADLGMITLATLVVAWFGWRAWCSPVAELGQADLFLLAGVVGAFISVRGIEGSPLAERILTWGIALLLLANVIVVGKQVVDPTFTPIFRMRASGFPSGFYAHYNEAANYLIASSLLVAAVALFGKHATITRIAFGLISLAGLAAVYFTHSRGGILGAAVGCGVFVVAGLVVAKHRGSRWFAPALIAIPLLAIAIGGYLLSGWEASQALRNAKTGITGLDGIFDNTCRLYFLGIAMSCIALHPLFGGGSRSFSWECFQFISAKGQGDAISHKPDQVHNELLQAITDYGLIGGGLVIVFLGAVAVVALIRILFRENSREPMSADAWRVGGLAALAGMFVQSNFTFVFHLMPAILLLGICLGLMMRHAENPAGKRSFIFSNAIITTAALACSALLLPMGWKGTQVTRIMWPILFSKAPQTSDENKIDALTQAIHLWPQPSFYLDRALAIHSLAAKSNEPNLRSSAPLALRDYQKAEELHPFDPVPAVNRGNLLSLVEQDAEAEEAYRRAIQLQGGMEPAFRGHFSLSLHLLRKGLRHFSAKDPAVARAFIESAAAEMEMAVSQMHWVTRDMVEPRVSIHESLGTVREADGAYKGALETYDFASKFSANAGARVNYRAGLLYGKLAAATWSEYRLGETLGYLIEAKQRIGKATVLPQGVTETQRTEYLTYLDQSISTLKAAKVEPIVADIKSLDR